MARYASPKNRYSGSGADLARHLLDKNGLQNVLVEATESGDHYDPTDKAVRLSEDNFKDRSLTAIAVAAHEVGHAIQDNEAYGPLRWRGSLVRTVQKFEKFGAGILLAAPFVGMFTRAPALGIIFFLGGLLTLASATIVHLVTLPVEIDASFGRALPMLQKHNILQPADKRYARKILKAAAYTYVSASLMSLLNIARWWAILRR